MASKFNLADFTERARGVLSAAQQLAARQNHDHVEIEHVLTEMLVEQDSVARVVLEKIEANPKRIGGRLVDELGLLPKSYRRVEQAFVGKKLLAALEAAKQESREFGDTFVSVEHMLISFAAASGEAGRLLRESGATPERLREEFKQGRQGKKITAPDGEASSVLSKYAADMIQMANEGRLQKVIGRDAELRRIMQVLSRRTKNNPVLLGEPGVGKTSIVEALVQRIAEGDVPLGLKGKRVVSLDVGSLVAGTSLRGQFEERIQKIVQELVASEGQIILFIDELHTIMGAGGGDGPMNAAGLLKPALARGEISLIGTTTVDEYRQYIEVDAAFERRFQPIAVEEPSVEQCISILRGIKQHYEIHHGVQITDEALVAAAKMTDRYITDRALPDKAIDAIDEACSRLRLEIDSKPTELDELERAIHNNEVELQALVGEQSASAVEERQRLERTIANLREEADRLHIRWEHEKEILDDITHKKEELSAAEAEVEEAQKRGELGRAAELKYSVLPQIKREIERIQRKSEDLSTATRMLKDFVGEPDVAAVIGEWTGIPVSKMVESEREKLLQMPGRLSESVIGQDAAIAIISEKVQTSRAGLQDRNRPIGNFLFVGPTGVGKTELAKAIARFLFDDEQAIVRIDMSEYMEQSKVNTLIGSARGYVGSEQGGVLTEAVRHKPYSVVLFDEAEKAHPDVFNILLQLMDEGRLTDSQGRTVDFSNTLVILTSNVGSKRIMDLTTGGECTEEELQEAIEQILREHFRPEFLNRLDNKIPFRALDLDDITKIARIQERKVRKLLAEQRMGLEITEAALDLLAREGYEPEYGARPLKRSFAQLLQQPLAREILEGKFAEGDTVVVTVAEGGEALAFAKG